MTAPEVVVFGPLAELLEPLPQDARERVIAWLDSAYGRGAAERSRKAAESERKRRTRAGPEPGQAPDSSRTGSGQAPDSSRTALGRDADRARARVLDLEVNSWNSKDTNKNAECVALDPTGRARAEAHTTPSGQGPDSSRTGSGQAPGRGSGQAPDKGADPRVAELAQVVRACPELSLLHGEAERLVEYLLGVNLVASREDMARAIRDAVFDLPKGATEAAVRRQLRSYAANAGRRRPDRPPGEAEHSAREELRRREARRLRRQSEREERERERLAVPLAEAAGLVATVVKAAGGQR